MMLKDLEWEVDSNFWVNADIMGPGGTVLRIFRQRPDGWENESPGIRERCGPYQWFIYQDNFFDHVICSGESGIGTDALTMQCILNYYLGGNDAPT
jgi:hypothetical protein